MRELYEREYRDWLLDQIHFKKRGYSILMDALHGHEFLYFHPMDDARAMDGVYLRRDFLGEYFLGNATDAMKDEFLSYPCSILEMLSALAIRGFDEWIASEDRDICDFFWEMCCNLGLDSFKNRGFSRKKMDDFNKIIHIWIHRLHKFDGGGSIFPVEGTERDHRGLSIWEQMMEYFTKNY